MHKENLQEERRRKQDDLGMKKGASCGVLRARFFQRNMAVQAPQNDLHHNPLLEQGVTRALHSGD